jgi:hypothetical protein
MPAAAMETLGRNVDVYYLFFCVCTAIGFVVACSEERGILTCSANLCSAGYYRAEAEGIANNEW